MTKVSQLTKKLKKLTVAVPKFDRVAYRKAYDYVYFKKCIRCTRCGTSTLKHMIKRHMKTRKCLKVSIVLQGKHVTSVC